MIVSRGPRAARGRVAGAALVVVAAALLSFTRATATGPETPPSRALAADVPPAICATCHRLPPADVLPRAAWRDELVRMQRIRDGSEQTPHAPAPDLPPDFSAALAWYELHAPTALAPPATWPAPSELPK